MRFVRALRFTSSRKRAGDMIIDAAHTFGVHLMKCEHSKVGVEEIGWGTSRKIERDPKRHSDSSGLSSNQAQEKAPDDSPHRAQHKRSSAQSLPFGFRRLRFNRLSSRRL